MNRLLKAARVYIYHMEELLKARNVDAIIFSHLPFLHFCFPDLLSYIFQPLSETSPYSTSGFRKPFMKGLATSKIL